MRSGDRSDRIVSDRPWFDTKIGQRFLNSFRALRIAREAKKLSSRSARRHPKK
jgi:hypothetical protein